MRTAVALVNGGLGLAYLGIGTLTLIDLKRGWRSLGFSHFGVAFIALAFTCGPHHLEHGLHVALGDRAGGPLDLVAVLFGLPAGIAFVLLRIEAFTGGRGDRCVNGTPGWLGVMPMVWGAYLAALVAVAITGASDGVRLRPAIAPNLLLVGIYMTIGYFLLRTQLRNRRELGGWSVSGLSLMAVFPTCALMHAVFAYYVATGVYGLDVHGFFIDWIAVPAGLYFLWAVRGLYMDSLRDWNKGISDERRMTAPVG